MPQAESESPDEGFFNDLSQQGPESSNTNGQETQADGSSKPKRIACVLCRKRKLRCDGARPTCATCKRLSHDCAYDEVRKKSGPKRGYVKLLEQRLRESAHGALTASFALLSNTSQQNKSRRYSRIRMPPTRSKMPPARTRLPRTSQARYSRRSRIRATI